jgi:hypothetical protein
MVIDSRPSAVVCSTNSESGDVGGGELLGYGQGRWKPVESWSVNPQWKSNLSDSNM